MRRVFAVVLLVAGCSAVALASVPEIDPASGGNALALIAGGLLILRTGRKKRDKK